MIFKKVSVKDIVEFLEPDILNLAGAYEGYYIDNIADMARVNLNSLDWVNPVKTNKQEIVKASQARVLLVDETVEHVDGKVLIYVKNPKVSLVKVIKEFFAPKFAPGIDPTAVIHPNAKIGKDNYIGPNCYIGECVIGDNNIIHSNVSIYDRTVIGNNNNIHSGALICVDGLGCVRNQDGTLMEFPQIGGVVIGDNCYIGGGVHIASGSLSDTIIEDGCKINGLCFIGSNDHLHQNVWITGSTMLCGSVEVGQDSNIFSSVVVRDWVKIGSKVTIGMGAVVTKAVPDGETWVGNPAKKFEKK